MVNSAEQNIATTDKNLISKKETPSSKGIIVAKYELNQNEIRFFSTIGLFNKQLVLAQEFLIDELTSIENFGNRLSLTRNGTPYNFVLKRKGESFTEFYAQILNARQECQKKLQRIEKVTNQKVELLKFLNKSLQIIDISFDILMKLHVTRIDWDLVATDTKRLNDAFSFETVMLPAFELNFSKLNLSTSRQNPKGTAKETFTVLKALYDYFIGLKPPDNLVDMNPVFEEIKTMIIVYYTLNDLVLARLVGDKDNKREIIHLQELIVKLPEGANFKLLLDPFLGSKNQFIVDEVRGCFKDHLRNYVLQEI
ncbi:MAG: hypothetical protein GX799_09365 [Crenarchaeota archaeon]|nr:hypothetical protein [Thermoproteota archaeon]